MQRLALPSPKHAIRDIYRVFRVSRQDQTESSWRRPITNPVEAIADGQHRAVRCRHDVDNRKLPGRLEVASGTHEPWPAFSIDPGHQSAYIHQSIVAYHDCPCRSSALGPHAPRCRLYEAKVRAP